MGRKREREREGGTADDAGGREMPAMPRGEDEKGDDGRLGRAEWGWKGLGFNVS